MAAAAAAMAFAFAALAASRVVVEQQPSTVCASRNSGSKNSWLSSSELPSSVVSSNKGGYRDKNLEESGGGRKENMRKTLEREKYDCCHVCCVCHVCGLFAGV